MHSHETYIHAYLHATHHTHQTHVISLNSSHSPHLAQLISPLFLHPLFHFHISFSFIKLLTCGVIRSYNFFSVFFYVYVFLMFFGGLWKHRGAGGRNPSAEAQHGAELRVGAFVGRPWDRLSIDYPSIVHRFSLYSPYMNHIYTPHHPALNLSIGMVTTDPPWLRIDASHFVKKI